MIQEEDRLLPEPDKVSIIVATILLVYAITPYIDMEVIPFSFLIFGAGFNLQVNYSNLVAILVALIAAVGTDWVLNSQKIDRKVVWEHWILPASTAWMIGIPLNSIRPSPQWWIIFALGGMILATVIFSEFIVANHGNTYFVPASISLIAVSFSLLLIVMIAVRASGVRLYLVFPLIVLSVSLVSLRTMFLKTSGKWLTAWSIGIGLVVGQMAVGIHYFHLSPLSFGLILLGLTYALIGFAGSIHAGVGGKTLWVEPMVMLLLIWILAIGIGEKQ